jgi:uncharacterized lipoprotein YmbA
MHINRRAMLALPMLIAAPALAGCGDSDPTYYTLAVWPGQVRRGLGVPTVIEVRKPNVAAFLDRDYIVRGTRDYHLRLAGNDAWAEPIASMVARVLAGDLAQRFPDATVYSSDAPVGGRPQALVELVVDRLDEDQSGVAMLHALLVVRGAHQAASPGVTIGLQQTPSGDGTAALVAALSELLGGLADSAADRLANLQPSSFATG